MRECIRCHTQMINTKTNKKGESIKLKLQAYTEGGSGDIAVTTGDGIFKPTFFDFIKLEVCPNCGEVSIYVDKDKL